MESLSKQSQLVVVHNVHVSYTPAPSTPSVWSGRGNEQCSKQGSQLGNVHRVFEESAPSLECFASKTPMTTASTRRERSYNKSRFGFEATHNDGQECIGVQSPRGCTKTVTHATLGHPKRSKTYCRLRGDASERQDGLSSPTEISFLGSIGAMKKILLEERERKQGRRKKGMESTLPTGEKEASLSPSQSHHVKVGSVLEERRAVHARARLELYAELQSLQEKWTKTPDRSVYDMGVAYEHWERVGFAWKTLRPADFKQKLPPRMLDV